MRHCPKCKKDKEETLDNFYHTKKMGWDCYCITCRKKINLENHHKRLSKKPIETERTCKTCKETYPLNNKYFHYKHKIKEYYANTCKNCRNTEQKAKSHKKKKTKSYLTRDRLGGTEEYSPEHKKQIEELYKNTLLKGLAEDRKQGLDIADVKLKVGQAYKIKTYYRNEAELYQGTLIQDCDRHLVFKSKNGRCESFLKVDLLLEHEYKEVNQ